MISKTLNVNKKIGNRDILEKIYSLDKVDGLQVRDICIDEFCISYDVISEDNETSISLILEEEISSTPTIEKVVISMEQGDLNALNRIKSVWE